MQVSYDGGSSWNNVLQFDNSDVLNARVKVDSTGLVSGTGVTLLGPLNNPVSAAGVMQFRFGITSALAGWFAIDNVKISGGVVGVPFQGISSTTQWNFKTADAPTLTVTIDRISMSENGGTAVGTVTRNLSTSASPTLLVRLTSNDLTEATVPATVTIPAGAASITFPITAVDDSIGDGTQTVLISATVDPQPSDYFSVPGTILVLDDDFPKVISLSPADDATAVPVGANLVITFDQAVKKGNGFVHVIRTSDNIAVATVDIQSAVVTVSGSVVTINPPADLAGLTAYYVRFEAGAILNLAAAVGKAVPLLTQDFELLPLGPAVFETVGVTATGKDFTTTPPSGFTVDNFQMPAGGVPEWNGWTFADKSFWAAEGGQGRPNFALGKGTIAIADDDEWDDTTVEYDFVNNRRNNSFNSLFLSAPINLATVVPNTAVLEFDSSFRPESTNTNNQEGLVDVSYDGGTTWANLLTLTKDNTVDSLTAANISEHRTIAFPNPGTGSMKLRLGLTGTNDYWWAIDNVTIKADVNGLTYPGIVNGANINNSTWNFTTADAPALTVTTASTPVAENVGTASATLTRSLGTTGAIVVSLASSDVSIATVPATVTIPAGQASATFAITVVDDAFADGLKNVTITATATDLVTGKMTLAVSDNEVTNVVVTELMFNPTGVQPTTEWIEVVNRGTTTADLSGWSLDDEDNTNWSAIPAGTLLLPKQVAVIYGNNYGKISVPSFRAEWKVPTTAVVVGTIWGDLANTPSAVPGSINENVALQDAGKLVVDRINYDDLPGTAPNNWPGPAVGKSIYVLDVFADNDFGSNWGASAVGTSGGVSPLVIVSPGVQTYNIADIGSPGTVPATASIATRGVFYNNSTGNGGNAFATDKVALLPGQSSTFVNYTNYSLGLNGVIVDVNSLPAATTATDLATSLTFSQWNGIDAPGFVALPVAAIPTITLVNGSGAGGSSRVQITFPDNTLQNTWLRVTVLANPKTGLTSNDVFYFGNVIADVDVGNTATALRVNAQDTSLIRNNQSVLPDSVAVNNIFDLNRDGRVNAQDTSLVRLNQQVLGIVAPLTTLLSRTLSTGIGFVVVLPPMNAGDTDRELDELVSTVHVQVIDENIVVPAILDTFVDQRIAEIQIQKIFAEKQERDEIGGLESLDDYFASLIEPSL